jgi:hypothetical protein
MKGSRQSATATATAIKSMKRQRISIKFLWNLFALNNGKNMTAIQFLNLIEDATRYTEKSKSPQKAKGAPVRTNS